MNLTFHGLGEPPRPLDPGEDDVWVSYDAFESVLDAAVGRDDIRLTFDDGNASDVELALPALRARGLRATFFVVAGRIGQPGFLDADAIRELLDARMGIGCHGMYHVRWAGLEDAQLREEIVSARTVVEDVIRRPVTEAACPFGSYDRRVLKMLRATGYRRVFTSDRGLVRRREFLQARNSVGPIHEADLLGQIASLDAAPPKPLRRRMELAVKRWR